MKEIQKVLICGLGAIGTIYASAISKYSSDSIKVLVDQNRFEKYKNNQITFNGEQQNFEFVLPDEKNFKPDLIIISTKFDGLFDAIKNIKNFVNDNTIIMSLLNGVTSEKYISDKYGEDKVLFSYFIGHSAMRNGRNVVQDGVSKIVLGSDKNLDNVVKVKTFFDKVGINYEVPDDIMYSLWLKFMLNVSSNQVSSLLRLTFGQMQSNEKCMTFLTNIMKEVCLIAKAEGIKNTEKMIPEALKCFYGMAYDGKTSMLQDVEAGRKTEVDLFAGTVVELGKKHNIPTPYNTVLKNIFDVIDARV